MISVRRDILWCILSMILLAGCSQPESDFGYTILNPSGTDVRDTLSYSLDMSDSTATYTIYLCGRLSSKFKYDPLNIKIFATSPSGNVYSENISLPTNVKALKKEEVKIKHTSGAYDIEWGYRTGIKPIENGIWKINLLLTNSGARDNYIIKGIHGFGAYCTKENEQ